MKKKIFILSFIFTAAAVFSSGMVIETGMQMLVYEHNSAAGFYAGPELSSSYRFVKPLDGLPLTYYTGIGINAAAVVELSSSYGIADYIIPVYCLIEQGLFLGGDIELRLQSGFGFSEYIDQGAAPQAAFGLTAGLGVRNSLGKGLYAYYDTSWAAVFPMGVVHHNWILSAGCGWKF